MSGFKIAGISVLAVIGGLLLLAQLQNMNLIDRPESASASIDTRRTSMLIHQYVNEEREKTGLRLLTWNDDLARVALAHSNDMLTRDYFDHVSPDGKSLRERYAENRISCVFGAENLTQGGPLFGQDTEEEIARNSVSNWMNSQLHRENILHPFPSQEGIGIAFNEEGNVAYITQNFC